ncbi:MAG: NHLP bacteriocin export ABC transporter permease/ATPase subunit [Lachnospiraceae bacterium]|nr:NHLP bacteriocin export ABC transporter permease/ATPase subunit [Lachnospiraceae bacterium]
MKLADSVLGNGFSSVYLSKREINKSAVDEILAFYHVKSREVPESIKDVDEIMQYLFEPAGIMTRRVRLEKGWRKDAFGAMLTTMKDKDVAVALIPSPLYGYTFIDPKTGKKCRVNAKNEELISENAYAFYMPFPLKKLGIPSLIKFILDNVEKSNIVWYLIFTLIVTLVGMITPYLNNLLFSDVIESGSIRVLAAIAVFMIASSVSGFLFENVQRLFLAKVNTKLDLAVEAATMMRLLSLPVPFFRKYSSGELANRSRYVGELIEIMISTCLSTGITSLFSLVYITQVMAYAPALVVPALTVTLTTVVLSIISSFLQMRVNREQMELSAKESGLGYAFVSGIQKIKLSGAEKRAFAKWGEVYAEESKRMYNPPLFLKLDRPINMTITLTGTLVMYYLAVSSGVSVSQYYAFNTAYAMLSGAFTMLSSITFSFSQIKPIIDMAKPVLEAEPETSTGKRQVTELKGGIELTNVSFRYDKSLPPVIDDLSLKINPGQYVAIVGKTGCGKTTLIRLLLGFERPDKGAIYYDRNDLNDIDVKSLRRRIGTVMQNGKLMQGDIYSNIVISEPSLDVSAAWEAAEIAGIADDIREMPMQMHTVISEGSGNISGGQRQRLMIARAIAPKPRILMFDEATSALDNVTQKQVSEALDSLNCTRIVIAHRLSTIRNCERILVLNEGKIAEDGTYDELIASGGLFAKLVAKQQV